MNTDPIKKSPFGIFRPVWDLDALLFWSIFTSCTFLMLWLLTSTTKTQLIENVYSRLSSLTNMTAATISPQLYEHGISSGLPSNIRDISLEPLQAVQDQNSYILAIAIVNFHEGVPQVLYATHSKFPLSHFLKNPELQDSLTPMITAAQESRQIVLSEWKFLFHNTVPLFTDRITKPEFSYKAIPGWRCTSRKEIPVVVIAFNAPEIQKPFLEIDDNNGTVMAIAILIATILSFFVRWRSMQRIQATQGRLDLLEQMRQRDAILAAITTSADEILKLPQVEQPLDRMVRRIGSILETRACYASLQQLDPSSETADIMLGELPKNGSGLTCRDLQDPALSAWSTLLKSGSPALDESNNISPPLQAFLEKRGMVHVLVVPVLFENKLIGLLVLEHTTAEKKWEPGILDSLKLAADLFGAAYARREQDLRLREGSKMQALGRMAGGVAHEFNNLLHIITGNLSRFLKDRNRPQEDHALASKILEASLRGSRIVEQLLHATRQSSTVLSPGNLNDTIQRTATLFQPVAKKDFKLVLNLTEELPVILMDEIQIQQVILNLLLNATDALTSHGMIRIRSGLAPQHNNANPRGFVFCEVTDNGSGIRPEDLERIFDPFFTTKSAGAGSGLGLSTSRGILEQQGGFIEASNRPGGGARFTFYLPVPAHLPQIERPITPATAARPVSGGILIADDEPLCRDVLTAYLDENNLPHWSARNGNELLQMAKVHAAEIKWVITDWTMPGPDGPQLVRELRRLLPASHILVVSGFALNTEDLPEIDRLIQKPFTPEQLYQAMQQLCQGN